MSNLATRLTAPTRRPRRTNSRISFSMSVVLPLLGRPTTPRTTARRRVRRPVVRGRLDAAAQTALGLDPVGRRVHVEERCRAGERHASDAHEWEQVEKAVRAGREQLSHVRQAARPVDAREAARGDPPRPAARRPPPERVEHPSPHAIGRDQVGRHGEHGLVERAAGSRRGRRSASRATSSGMTTTLCREVGRRLLRAPHRKADAGKTLPRNVEVPLQKRLAVQAQPAACRDPCAVTRRRRAGRRPAPGRGAVGGGSMMRMESSSCGAGAVAAAALTPATLRCP